MTAAGTVLLVALGCAAGAVLRLLVATAVPGRRGTLVVNLTGSLLAGLVAAGGSGSARLLLGAGLCGGLTTFGTWAAEVADGDGGPVTRYVAGTVVGCLLAAAAGLALGS